MSDYPDALDNLVTDSTNDDDSIDYHPALHNDANSAIHAVQATLGLNPEGDSGDVAGRFDDIDSTTADTGKGFVNHGSVASTARPSGFASIEWFGSVEPDNMADGDTWINV